MSQKYYFRFRGRVLGPMTAEKIGELVQRGQVTRMHEISTDGVQWQKAEEFVEFYPKKSKAAIEAKTSDTAITLVAAPVQPTPEWYAHIGSEHEGPVNEDTIRAWIAAGRVSAETLIWKNGLQEWTAAKTLQPQWFPGKKNKQQSSPDDRGADQGFDVTGIVRELQKRRSWIYVLSITGIVLSGLIVFFMVFVLVSQFAAPAETGGAALTAIFLTLFAFALTVLSLIAFVCLIQYANALSVLHFAPTEENFLRSLKKLSSFWLNAGICILAVLVTTLFVTLLVYASGMGLLHVLER